MINDPNVESHNKNRQSFMIIRTILCECVTKGGGEGGLPCPFSEIKKSALILGKTLTVVIYRLNFLFKGQFLRVSRKKPRRLFPAGLLFFVLWMIVY